MTLVVAYLNARTVERRYDVEEFAPMHPAECDLAAIWLIWK